MVYSELLTLLFTLALFTNPNQTVVPWKTVNTNPSHMLHVVQKRCNNFLSERLFT